MARQCLSKTERVFHISERKSRGSFFFFFNKKKKPMTPSNQNRRHPLLHYTFPIDCTSSGASPEILRCTRKKQRGYGTHTLRREYLPYHHRDFVLQQHGRSRHSGTSWCYPRCRFLHALLIRIVDRVRGFPFILFIVKVYLYRFARFLIILPHHCAAVKIKTMLYS